MNKQDNKFLPCLTVYTPLSGNNAYVLASYPQYTQNGWGRGGGCPAKFDFNSIKPYTPCLKVLKLHVLEMLRCCY